MSDTRQDRTAMRWVWRTALVVAAPTLWLLMLQFPTQAAGPELDPSWQTVLAHDLLSETRFGVETIFPYGPFGYLLTTLRPAYVNAQFATRIVWDLLAKIVVVLVFLRLAASFRMIAVRLLVLALLVLIAPVIHPMAYPLTIALLTLTLLDRARPGRLLLAVVLAVFAFLSLGKFNWMLLSAMCVLALSVHV